MIYESLKDWRLDCPVRKLRLQLNLTQKQLSDALGATKYIVYAWEKGRSMPNADNFKKLVDLGLSMEDLVSWKASKPLDTSE